MAGEGSRFKEAGYVEEKYAIKFKGHSLFAWSLVSLREFQMFPLTVVTRPWPGVESFVRTIAAEVGFRDVTVVFVDYLTRGQAETADLAINKETDEPILIFNTDTYIDPRMLKPDMVQGDGWIPYFPAEGNRWSFVELNSDGVSVLRTTEKERISPHCSVGVYYFKSSKAYSDLVKGLHENSREWYIAPMYNDLIAAGGDVRAFALTSYAVAVLGTPEDLALAEARDLAFPANQR